MCARATTCVTHGHYPKLILSPFLNVYKYSRQIVKLLQFYFVFHSEYTDILWAAPCNLLFSFNFSFIFVFFWVSYVLKSRPLILSLQRLRSFSSVLLLWIDKNILWIGLTVESIRTILKCLMSSFWVLHSFKVKKCCLLSFCST